MFHHPNQPPQLSIPGYRLTEELYVGGSTAVYRALTDADAQPSYPVVIKVLQSPHPSVKELVRFRNQYTLAKGLSLESIVRPLRLEPWRHGYALVMEDVGGIALSEYLQRCGRLPVGEVLAIALQMADILHHLSQHRVLHKDINPANILIHPDTHKIWLTDFSLASLLPKDSQQLQPSCVLEGTLAYLAPEQTGRIHQAIDYRADLYGLGVTLYQLLTGVLPFQVDDPTALIHCHIAKAPVPPCEVVHREARGDDTSWAIPQVVSDIVLKLMAKNAEDRYQSALGLKPDLERCVHQWTSLGQIEPFELGQQDRCDRFLISTKLYGRDSALQTLLDAFDRISGPPRTSFPQARRSRRELVLVTGSSGMGKTAVVDEVYRSITRQKGYFLKGKFDQFNRDIPFSGFVQAFRHLMVQLQGESDAALADWKNKILAAVGTSGQVLIDVIPELAQIIGTQPVVVELSGAAAQNRFDLLFGKFVEVFANREHPLVIFLDDLQWVDPASLSLLMVLLNDAPESCLLMIGAYRNNEVTPTHPLMLRLAELEQTSAMVSTLTLGAMDVQDVNQLVAETLNCSQASADSLARLIYHQTTGNPFFVRQLLQGLYDDGLITFNTNLGYWEGSLADINQSILSHHFSDVVEFISGRLSQLSQETQEILWLAACIGHQFDLETLSIICQKSQQLIMPHLWEALQAGLLLPIDDTYQFLPGDIPATDIHITPSVQYCFLHDHVQQAAYGLVPKHQQTQVHYNIGQLLLQKISEAAADGRIFELVTHLNYGFEFIPSQVDRNKIAELNLKAAKKARKSTAYRAGFRYAIMGISLLGDSAWQDQYEKSLHLHELAAELAFLYGNLERSQQFIEIVIQQAQSLLDQINISCLKIQILVAQAKLTEAITTAQQILQRLGLSLSQPLSSMLSQPYSQDDTWQQVLEIEQILGGREISALSQLPVMTDQTKIAMVRIISSGIPAAYISGSSCFPLWVILATKLSIQFGNIPASAFIYINYSYILCYYFHAIDAAEAFGQLALQLVDEFDAKTVKPQVFIMFGLYALHRKSSLRETLPLLAQGCSAALEVGNYEWAGYGAYAFCANAFSCSEDLTALEQKIKYYCDEVTPPHQMTSKKWCQIHWQSVLNLIGPSENPVMLSGELFQEEDFFCQLSTTQDLLGLFYFHLHKLMLCYLFGANDLARTHAIEARKYLTVGGGTVGMPMFYFYDALSALKELQTLEAGADKYKKLLQQVNDSQTHLQEDWANHAPMNYQHKVDLIAAEKSYLMGRFADAIDQYDQSIVGSRDNQYCQSEALANELAAKFYWDWGKARVAAGYLQEAYYCYARWGAKSKTDDLETRYPQLLQPILSERSQASHVLSSLNRVAPLSLSVHSSSGSEKASKGALNEKLDLAAVLKAAQTLSESIELGELLETLAQMMLQTSGAERLALILPNAAGAWQVSVTATPESIQQDATLLASHTDLPIQLIQYVQRTQETLVIDGLDATLPIVDPYLQKYQPRSVLCVPLLHQKQLKGLLYLQHQSMVNLFHRDRILILNFLCTQAAISLANSQLYQTLEQRFNERTQALQESQCELTDYIENAATSLYWVDANGIIIWANQTAVDFLGYSCEEYIGQPIANMHADKDVIDDIFTRLSNYETIVNYEARLRCKDGSIRYVQINSNVFSRDGEFIHTRCFTTDITERKLAEMALNDLVEGTAATIGTDFFPALVRHISAALEVPIALVTQFVDQELQGLALIIDGELQPNVTCPLSETPCSKLLLDYAYYCSHSLSEYFPNHPNRDRGMDSYLGVALRDGQGQVLGSLCVFDRKPLRDPERAQQILNVFGSRAAAELGRQRIETALKNLVAGTAAVTGPDFFTALVRYIAEALQVSHVFVSEVVEGDQLRLLAVWGDGPHLPGDTVDVAVTTCAVTLKEGVYYCEHEVSAKFPQNPLLASIEVESYMGVVLQNRQGQSLGTLCVFARQAIVDPDRAKQILQVFAARTTAELERQRAEEAMEQLNRELEARVCDRTAQLAASENRFRTLFNQATDAVFLMGDHGFIDCNQAAVDLLKYPSKIELLLCQPHQISPEYQPDGQQSVIKAQLMIQEALQQNRCRFEWMHQRFDGDLFWAESTLTPIRDQEDVIFHTIVRDITDRKQLEQEQERLMAVLEATPDFIGIANTQGEILWHNKPLRSLRADLANPGEPQFITACHPDWANEIIQHEAFPTAIAQGSWSGESALLDGEGNEIPVSQVIIAHKSKSGTVENFSTIMRDIRDRKQADANSRLLASVVESSNDAIITKNLEGIITSWNRAAVKLFGYTASEVLGQSIKVLFPADRLQEEPKILALLQNNESIEHFETVRLHKNGTRIDISVTISPLTDKHGTVVGASKIVRDISDRKHYEKQLKDLSERLELALESAHIGIWEWDCQTDHLVWDNRMFEIYGVQTDDFGESYQDWAKRVHPDDFARAEAQKKDYDLSGLERYTQEFRILRPDNTVRYILSSASMQRDAQGQLMRLVGLNLDITDRKEAELALQDSQAQFRRMTENVPGMIFRYVLHPDNSDELTYVSSQVRTVFEVEPEDALREPACTWGRIHPDDIPRLMEAVQVSAETLQPFTSSYRLLLPEKGLRWVQNMSHPQRLANGDVVWDGIAVDISDRKQVEMALEKELLRRAAVFNASPDGIHILDQVGNLLEANKVFGQMLGYQPDEVSRLNVADWDAQWSHAELQDILQDVFSDSVCSSFDTLHRRKDGSVFPVEVSVCSMKWNDECALVCIARDISERKQAEAQLKRTNQELARATRLKDEFLANMSHELRTPLNAILGMTEGLQAEIFGAIEEPQLKALTTIEQSGSHLLELINEILDLAKIEAGNIELSYSIVSVTHLCQASLAFIKQQALEQSIQLHLNIPWDLPSIRIDERRIRQVLINLLHNAVKFTAAGGHVTLKVMLTSPDEDHGQRCLCFAVRDTGIGISPAELNQLFQPFIQIDSALNRQYEGTGLGLALVKRIVELHGGRVTVTSTVGVGSCFTIELPYDTAPMLGPHLPVPIPVPIAVSPEMETSEAESPEIESPELGQVPDAPLILLAEDNEANRITLSSYLQARGYRIQVAPNGKVALELAQAEVPHLILMDIQMPDMNGLAAIQRLRQIPTLKHTPIIALTACAMDGDQARCLAAGADQYVSKPIKLQQLTTLIQALIAASLRDAT